MSDQQPLLKSQRKVSSVSTNIGDGENDVGTSKQLSSSTILSDWHQCFGRKKTRKEYGKLDDNIQNNDYNSVVGVLDLFRFANGLDCFVMFIAFCISLLQTTCILTNLWMFGRLTGAFVNESFSRTCNQHLNTTLITNSSSKNRCPDGIELNSFNYDRLHHLCRVQDSTSLTEVDLSASTFRETVMEKVHWLIIIALVIFLCSTIQDFLWACVTKGHISRMKICLFRSLIQRNISCLDGTTAGQLNSKLFDNINKIDQGIGFDFLFVIDTLFCMAGSLVLSFIINWKFTLIMMSIIPIVVGLSAFFSRLTAKESLNELNTYATAGHIVQEVFSSLRTVHSLNGSKFEQQRYEQHLEPTRWSTTRRGAIFGVYMGWFSFTTNIVYSASFIGGSLFISYGGDNKLNISDILVVVSIFAQCMSFFSLIGPFLQTFSAARGAAAPVLRLIDEGDQVNINEPEIWDGTLSHEQSLDMKGDIEFNHVNFTYPARKDVPILRNLSLIARAGQTTALVGSSGCGKSTCLSLLLRFYEPSSGQIKINGQSITDMHLKQYRQNIGIVSQEPILFGMSIYENIRFGKINATQAEIEEAARQANAHNFIMRLPQKYGTLVGERGIQLSGGEKQRVALARALIKQPTILILDEATSALDNVSENLVQEALDRACKNRTTIVVAHRLTTIQNADRIYVLDKGDVIEEGTHESLLANEEGKYKKMVKSQQLGKKTEEEDKLINIGQVMEEDEPHTTERSRLLSINQADDTNQERQRKSAQQSIFMRLLSMNRPEWVTILIGCTACLFNGAAQTVFAILLSKIVGTFQDCADHRHQMYLYSFLFLLLGILVLFFRFFQYTAFAIAGSRLVQRIRAKAFASLLRQEMAYFDKPENSSGAICARLSSEASALQEMVGTRLGVVFEATALSCFGLAFGMLFSWQLTIITTFPFACFAGLFYFSIKHNQRANKISASFLEEANILATEVMQNLRTIKQLSIEVEMVRQYSKIIHDEIMQSWNVTLLSNIAYGLRWALQISTSALLFWRALVLVEQKELDAADIVMVYAFATFALQSMRVVGNIMRTISLSLSAAKTFFILFDRTPTIDNGSTEGQTLSNFRGEIEFDRVKFAYPTRPSAIVLNEVRLKIKPGQRVALIGSSGCGKSTSIQLLERFYDVAKGQISFDGVDTRQLNIQWLRSHLGLVSQEPILFDLSIGENITYGLENISMNDIIDATTKANIHQFIQQLPEGYQTRVGTKGTFLSGGEKQRVAIARALLRKPKILLLDEATSAMDSNNEQVVQEALDKAQTDDLSRTSLIIAHRLSTIRSCDLICVLDRGRIIESGTHAELKQQRGVYYRMLTQDNLT